MVGSSRQKDARRILDDERIQTRYLVGSSLLVD